MGGTPNNGEGGARENRYSLRVIIYPFAPREKHPSFYGYRIPKSI
jgi:hypothetical protein